MLHWSRNELPNISSECFELPYGDTIFALWNHNRAVDNNTGERIILTFSGLYKQPVIAVDAPNGFEQELIITQENGLIIKDINILDYPFILRISES